MRPSDRTLDFYFFTSSLRSVFLNLSVCSLSWPVYIVFLFYMSIYCNVSSWSTLLVILLWDWDIGFLKDLSTFWSSWPHLSFSFVDSCGPDGRFRSIPSGHTRTSSHMQLQYRRPGETTRRHNDANLSRSLPKRFVMRLQICRQERTADPSGIPRLWHLLRRTAVSPFSLSPCRSPFKLFAWNNGK